MKRFLLLGAALLTLSASCAGAQERVQRLPNPAVAPAEPSGLQTVIFSGGCFWGVQGVFEHVKGVQSAISGYAGGKTRNPTYEEVSSGETGHAESVKVVYDPKKVSFAALTQIFFSVVLDPTQVNRQGPDSGTQYRSEIFYSTAAQKTTAEAYVRQLTQAHIYSRPIATRIEAAAPFYAAEGYHQDYLRMHPNAPYIAYNDIPKVEATKKFFPEYWREDPIRAVR